MRTYNILFLCTHNSARSIIGEAVASTQTNGRFVGYSAGSAPTKSVNPLARELAEELGYPVGKLRSKSWDEFASSDAPQMDFIITVCDSAAGEACPVWLGQPVTAHWGFADPSRVSGTDDEKRKAFEDVMQGLRKKIQRLAELPLDQLDLLSIQMATRELARV